MNKLHQAEDRREYSKGHHAPLFIDFRERGYPFAGCSSVYFDLSILCAVEYAVFPSNISSQQSLAPHSSHHETTSTRE